MASPASASATVTFLYTDIEGSTRLWELQPEAMRTALARHDEILNRAIQSNGGHVFRTAGDAFSASFSSAPAALLAAVEAQRDLYAEDWQLEGPIGVRIALHTGQVEQQGGDYVGSSLNHIGRLLSVCHGGQTLLTLITEELVRDQLPDGVSLLDLGKHRFRGLLHPEQVYQLILPGLPSGFPPLQSLDLFPNNLPVQPTPFIGRAAQLAALKELLLGPDVRLVTLTGPGGTGKTRLSLQVAQELLDQFTHGAFFVPLADDTNPEQFVSRVAQQLEVRQGGRPLLENVKDYLRDKRMLLLLDNFEQLLSAAPVAADLLAAAPHLKMLVSSRIALNLHGERAYPVPPLDLPQPLAGSELSAEQLAGNEAVLLFVERGRAAQPNFSLTNDNAATVAEICRRLDGLPLALELAAARIKLLPPQAILARLDDRLRLLTGGARDLPERHKTLRSTLEWSYGLLDPQEKTLYARLGVFVGGFTLEAAEAVCNPASDLDILEGLTSLVDNSLIRQDETANGEPRFGMLETIREYAVERLADSRELALLQERQAGYFGDLIRNQAESELYSVNALYWLDWLEREIDNVRATLNWSLADPQRIQLAAELVWAMLWFCYRRGYLSEGRLWSKRVLASPAIQEPTLFRANALLSGGFLAVWQGEQEAGLVQLQESLAIVLKQENEQMVPPLLLANGVGLINMGRDREAQPLLEQALALFKQAGVAYFHVFSTVHLGNVELGLGNPARAQALHEEAESAARAINDSWLLSFALNNLGEVARTQGQYDRARSYYEECEVLLRDTGDRGDLARFAHSLGYVALYEGDNARAEDQFRKSLTMFRRLGNRRGISECLAGLAGLKARQGRAQWGATLLSAAESLLLGTGGAWWPADRLEVERNRRIMQSALSPHEFEKAWQAGQTMTIDQAISFASSD